MGGPAAWGLGEVLTTSRPKHLARYGTFHKSSDWLLDMAYAMARACGTMGDKRGGYRVLVGDPRERDHLEDLDVDGRVILKLIFKKLTGGRAWAGLIWLRIVTFGGSF